jgi:hypothetical protein
MNVKHAGPAARIAASWSVLGVTTTSTELPR